MSTTDVGRAAETVVADLLQKHGFMILERNWRTRWCEVDIIAEKADVVYFVEVKCRATATYGDGLDYITPEKLRHLRLATALWLSQTSRDGDCELLAVAVGRNSKIVAISVID